MLPSKKIKRLSKKQHRVTETANLQPKAASATFHEAESKAKARTDQ